MAHKTHTHVIVEMTFLAEERALRGLRRSANELPAARTRQSVQRERGANGALVMAQQQYYGIHNQLSNTLHSLSHNHHQVHAGATRTCPSTSLSMVRRSNNPKGQCLPIALHYHASGIVIIFRGMYSDVANALSVV